VVEAAELTTSAAGSVGATPLPRVLCVDLDGTLIRTDLLAESAFSLFRTDPWQALHMPAWLLRGKPVLKERIASRAEVDATLLPYDARVLELIEQARAAGMRIVLATASHRRFAQQVADHLGVFDEVIATEGDTNLSGEHKRQRLVERFGERGFAYVGNSRDDLAVWRSAARGYVVNAPGAVLRAAQRIVKVERVMPREAGMLAYLRQLRLHQWTKNLLLFLPLILAHQVHDLGLLLQTFLGFVAFGLTASCVYIVNDLLDLEADRHHIRKRLRPLAAGHVPIHHAVVLAPLLLLAALLICLLLPWKFLAALTGYFALTVAYSSYLKRRVMLDVVTLAALYTARILAGAAVTDIALSFWLLAFSTFLFLSLALVKRCSELVVMRNQGLLQAKGRGYQVADLMVLVSLGGASGYLAVLVMALYINSPEVRQLYSRPELLWLVCPAFLYWTGRVWILAHRGKVHDDPIVFALRDRVSQLLALFTFVLVLAAA
jgi:4-hydroxybenzoate polyprenyltransferase/phosphoserine phosphatase